MTQVDFEKGLIVSASWQLASSSDTMELLGVACVLRNRVMRNKLKRATYGEAVQYFLKNFRTRGLPLGNEPALVDPREGLLAKVDAVYDSSLPDVTSSMAYPLGASQFYVARSNPELVVGLKLIGTFGNMQFYV